MGRIIDPNIDELYENSANDFAEPFDDNGNLQVSDGNGKTRYDVALEHGASLEINESGEVIVGNNEVVGSPHQAIQPKISKNAVGDAHTHTNEGKGTIMLRGGVSIDTSNRGPSRRDSYTRQAKSGYYDVVVDDKSYYFYDNKTVINISKDKLK